MRIHSHDENETVHAVVPNHRVGAYYLAGMLLLVSLALWFQPWGLMLLWPAASLGVVAFGYFKAGAAIFLKNRGRIPLAVKAAFAPVLLGQYLSLLHYRRQCREWDEVTPQVLIGRLLDETEARQAIAQGVTAVLDLTGEFSEIPAFRSLAYLNVPVLDLTAPTRMQFQQAVDFIEAESRRGKVYVHCKIGYSRSAAVLMAWLVKSGHSANLAEAEACLRKVRPSIVIRPEVLPAVEAFLGGRG